MVHHIYKRGLKVGYEQMKFTVPILLLFGGLQANNLTSLLGQLDYVFTTTSTPNPQMELIDKEAKAKLAAYSGKKQRGTVQFNSGFVRAPSHVPIHIAVKYTLTNKHKQRFEFLLIHHAAKRQKTQVSFEGVCVCLLTG